MNNMMSDLDKVKVQMILEKRKIEIRISNVRINVFNNLIYKFLLLMTIIRDKTLFRVLSQWAGFSFMMTRSMTQWADLE